MTEPPTKALTVGEGAGSLRRAAAPQAVAAAAAAAPAPAAAVAAPQPAAAAPAAVSLEALLAAAEALEPGLKTAMDKTMDSTLLRVSGLVKCAFTCKGLMALAHMPDGALEHRLRGLVKHLGYRKGDWVTLGTGADGVAGTADDDVAMVVKKLATEAKDGNSESKGGEQQEEKAKATEKYEILRVVGKTAQACGWL